MTRRAGEATLRQNTRRCAACRGRGYQFAKVRREGVAVGRAEIPCLGCAGWARLGVDAASVEER